MTKNIQLTVHVVLDRSGSMSSIKDDAIGGFNEYVTTLTKTTPGAKLSLTIFDDQSIDTIVDNVTVGAVTPLNNATYQPRANTPLYDAIGKVVGLLDKAKGKNKALVILTDGYENASREYTKDAVKKLLDEKQEKDNWLVLYLGANQDAFAVGGAIGTSTSNTMNYAANSKGMRSSFASAANATTRYSSSDGDTAFAAFTTEEREEAKGK